MGVIDMSGVWLRKIERNYQDHGLGSVVRKALSYVARPLYNKQTYRLYKIDFGSAVPEEPAALEDVDFRFLNGGDSEAIRQIESISEWLHGTLAERIRDGGLCLAAFEDNHVIGFNLISFGDVYMPLVGLHRRFRKNEAWSEQIAVEKNSRKKGLGTTLRLHVFRELRTRGYRKLYGGALVDNLPSLKLARRVGFHEFVDIRYTRVLADRKWVYARVK